MRRYWQPFALQEELPANDCPPIRVRILGEDLIAFRDTSGAVGLVDAFCPHRRAPMFFGRNEECGLRCVYHGWKFDREGTCVDMPSEPTDSLFKSKVKIKAYPTYEAGGAIWTYMGPPELVPSFPDYEWMRAPSTHGFVSKTFEHANWLQGLEGGIDSSHSSFLHNDRLGNRNLVRNTDGAPRLEVEKTDYGFHYSSSRNAGDRGTYVRIYQFVMPHQQMRGAVTSSAAGEEKLPKLDGHIWVPIDDEHTYVWNWMCSYDKNHPISPEFIADWEATHGRGRDDLLPGYKLKQAKENDYHIDRERQRTKTYTGIRGFNTQDFMIQEGMGPIADRTKEHVGSSDRAIIAARQLLLEACDVVERGGAPRGSDAATYRNVRPYDNNVPPDKTWQEAFRDELVAKW